MFGFLLLTHLAAIHWLRHGRFIRASLSFLLAHWVLYTVLIAQSPGMLSRAIILYLIVPLSAAWLMGPLPALWSAGVCVLSGALLAGLQTVGVHFHGYFDNAGPVVNWSETLVAMMIAAVSVAQLLQALESSRKRLQSSQEALQEYRLRLEDLVRSRTAELEQAREQAEAASRAKTGYLATLSHQLRSPLNAILLLSEMASTDPHITKEHCQDWRIIHRSGQHLLHLIDQVLATARIEAGQVLLENVRFDLTALLDGVVDLMRVQAEQKQLSLRLETTSIAPPQFVYADQDKLRQVLINLIDNAIKYTARGQITVREYALALDLTSRIRLRFEIVDTGIGIAQEDQARVFEPFTRLGSGTEGAGLGLAITRQYVELMGGNIRVDSVPGRGSRFLVEIPALAADSGRQTDIQLPQSTQSSTVPPNLTSLLAKIARAEGAGGAACV